MNTIIVACKTLENELNAAMAASDCSYEIKWIESGLHNVPKKLHNKLQDTLDQCTGYDTVLLVMGFCGNSVAEIRTHGFTLVMPRVDDCISLLLDSDKHRMKQSAGGSTYFLTEGWLEGERNIWKEYEYTTDKYGAKLGQEIFDSMFHNYRNLALIDTGCFDMANAIKEAQKIARKLDLNYIQLPGTIEYLKELLSFTWDPKRFITIPPHSQLGLSQCTYQES